MSELYGSVTDQRRPGKPTHDVFISYAHIDDEPAVGVEHGWVTTFVIELIKELSKKSGRRSVAWMDGKLEGNDKVSDTLVKAVEASRTLVLFMSPSYERSRWCQEELITFLEANGPVKNKESVFIIEVEPVARDTLHPRLQELTPFRFWGQDTPFKPARRLGHPLPRPDEENPYWRNINELAHALSTHLQRLATVEQSAPEDGGDAPDLRTIKLIGPAVSKPKPVVWLAEPTADLRDYWEQLAGTIRQAGCQPLPASSVAYSRTSSVDLKAAVRADLGNAILAVQLLGPGPVGVNDRVSGEVPFPVLENAVAAEWARATNHWFLQWRPPGVTLEQMDLEYRELATGAISCLFETFRQRLVKTISAVLFPPPGQDPRGAFPVEPVTQARQSMAICVNAERRDRDLALAIVQILRDLGAEPLPTPDPAPGQSPSEFHSQLDEVIGGSEGVIIVYGETPPAWVQAQYVRARKVLAQQRRGIWGALLEGPPSPKQEHGVVSSNIMPIDCRQGLVRERIARFVDTLRGSLNG